MTPQRMPILTLVRKPIEVVCGCKGCKYVAIDLDPGKALRRWAAHRVNAHKRRAA